MSAPTDASPITWCSRTLAPVTPSSSPKHSFTARSRGAQPTNAARSCTSTVPATRPGWGGTTIWTRSDRSRHGSGGFSPRRPWVSARTACEASVAGAPPAAQRLHRIDSLDQFTVAREHDTAPTGPALVDRATRGEPQGHRRGHPRSQVLESQHRPGVVVVKAVAGVVRHREVVDHDDGLV